MKEIQNLFTEKEIDSIKRFLGYDRSIPELVGFIENHKYNPSYETYFKSLLQKLMVLTTEQSEALTDEARRITYSYAN